MYVLYAKKINENYNKLLIKAPNKVKTKLTHNNVINTQGEPQVPN